MDKLREEFEQWAANDRSELDVWQRGHKAGEYKNPVVAKMWKAWQASRASIVVELPSTDNYWNGTSGHKIFNHRQFAADSCDALRDIGLSIKGE